MANALEDKDAIRELLSTYCFYLDRDRDPDALTGLFAKGGHWEGLGAGRLEGPALREFMAMAVADPRKFRHLVTNANISVDGDRARARSYVAAFAMDSGSPVPFMVAYYEDTLVRIDGHWLFSARMVHTE